MFKHNFGTKDQVHFTSENEYYEVLGYLAKSDGTTSIVWEPNEEQGAWGSEGRILIYVDNFPFIGNFDLTAGVGNIKNRINCNEFVENIRDDHGFIITGGNQDIDAIRNTVPAEYLSDFNRGLNL
jgi:hypothetical protein